MSEIEKRTFYNMAKDLHDISRSLRELVRLEKELKRQNDNSSGGENGVGEDDA